MSSLKFPVFVRARKEQHLPPTQSRKSLLEQLRHRPIDLLADAKNEPDRGRDWVNLLRRSKTKQVRFCQAFCSGQSLVVRGISVAPILSFFENRGRLEEKLELTMGLTPIQSICLPSVLECGQDTVITAPVGSGKRSLLIYCACKIASHFTSEPRRLTALVVFSSNDDLHFCRRWLFAAAGDKLKITRFGVCDGERSVGDVCLATVHEIGDIYEQNRSEMNLQNVRFCGVVGADRVVVPPLTERTPLSCWNWLRQSCHRDCVMMLSGTVAPRVQDAAKMIVMGRDAHSDCEHQFTEVQLIDSTAWINVIHSVLLVDEMVPVLSELLSCSEGGSHIIIAANKKQVEEFEYQLSARASSDINSFRQGKSSLLTSEWAAGCLVDVPRSVGTVINIGLPRSNFEEVLSSRAQRLLPVSSRSSVCEVITLVPRRSARSVAKRLKAFLESTNQRVPFFLSSVPSH